jgi:hypothetical protein
MQLGRNKAPLQETAMAIVNQGLSASAKLNNYFDTTPTYGTPEKTALDVRLDVNDAYVRQQFDYDGFERPFAMVPHEVNGQVEWRKEALQYQGTSLGGYIDLKPVDHYELVEKDADRAAIAKYGIALGMDTNNGTVWAQAPDHNLWPTGD